MSGAESTSAPSRAAQPSAADWSRAYGRRVLFTDLLVLIWVVFGVQIAWLGFDSNLATNANDLRLNYTADLDHRDPVVARRPGRVRHTRCSCARRRQHRVPARGRLERPRVRDPRHRGVPAPHRARPRVRPHRVPRRDPVPAALAMDVATVAGRATPVRAGTPPRSCWSAPRRACSTSPRSSRARPRPATEFWVPRCPGGHIGALPGSGVQSYGGFDDILTALEQSGADTVVITSADDLPPERVRELSWSLEPGKQHLVVAPSLTDIGGPRIHTRPVQGLPLIHVETPTYEGRKLWTKRAFDIVGSAADRRVVAGARRARIRGSAQRPARSSSGRSASGSTGAVRMVKFRSMRVEPDAELAALLCAGGQSTLVQDRDDPRVTPVGRFMRRSASMNCRSCSTSCGEHVARRTAASARRRSGALRSAALAASS